MRHGASLLASMEGMSRHAFRIAHELAQKHRSGLTVRFLSKKLEIPQEEIEYLLEVHDRLFYTDLSKVKLAPDGQSATKRILDGLESHGDIPSLETLIRSMSSNDFGQFEIKLNVEQPLSRAQSTDHFIDTYYRHPDAIMTYVAMEDFSDTAREVFDLLWQSPKGILSAAQLRAVHGGSDAEVEEAIWELVQNFALFEMFRFDNEDRLVRVIALLAEIRRYREEAGRQQTAAALTPANDTFEVADDMALTLSENIARMVAVLAARPARLRTDGDVFKEDQKRLAQFLPEGQELTISTCLWLASCAGWLHIDENILKIGDLETIISMNRLDRHRELAVSLMIDRDAAFAQDILQRELEHLESGDWYLVDEFIKHALESSAQEEEARLLPVKNRWIYYHPSNSDYGRERLHRMLMETLHWLGLIAHARRNRALYFRLTPLGVAFLTDNFDEALYAQYPAQHCSFVVQPNFEIVIANDNNDPLLTVPLEQFAERSGSQQATIYTVTKHSFTKAVQIGHDPNKFIAFLLKHNRNGSLPPNVQMTLEDWQGGMKRVKLRTIHILESDDPLVLADLSHRQSYEGHFAPLDADKMLSYSGISKARLIKALEKDGFVVD